MVSFYKHALKYQHSFVLTVILFELGCVFSQNELQEIVKTHGGLVIRTSMYIASCTSKWAIPSLSDSHIIQNNYDNLNKFKKELF